MRVHRLRSGGMVLGLLGAADVTAVLLQVDFSVSAREKNSTCAFQRPDENHHAPDHSQRVQGAAAQLRFARCSARSRLSVAADRASPQRWR
jgi:hypothetical protein